MVSCVVKVLLATMKSVSALQMPQHQRDVVTVDVGDEVELRPGAARQASSAGTAICGWSLPPMPMLTTWRMPLPARLCRARSRRRRAWHRSTPCTSSLNGLAARRAAPVCNAARPSVLLTGAPANIARGAPRAGIRLPGRRKLQRRRVRQFFEGRRTPRRLDRQRRRSGPGRARSLAQVELAAITPRSGRPAPSGLQSDRSAARRASIIAVQLGRVDREGADAPRLLGGHRVLVERPAETGLVVGHRSDGRLGGRGRIEHARHRGLGRLQLRQQLGADGEQVAAGQPRGSGRRCGSSRPSPSVSMPGISWRV